MGQAQPPIQMDTKVRGQLTSGLTCHFFQLATLLPAALCGNICKMQLFSSDFRKDAVPKAAGLDTLTTGQLCRTRTWP